jgi:Ca2+:H+ antiporter
MTSSRSRHASRQPSRDSIPMEDRSPRRSHQHNGRALPPPATFSQYKRHRGTSANKSRGMIQPAGESGRRGFHPWKFLRISFRSASRASLVCNVLWPVVPAALAVRCELISLGCRRASLISCVVADALPEKHVLIFSLAYIAMVPCANLVGFAGQELARKFPHVAGVLAEIT